MENSKISEGWVFKTPQKYISSQEDVRLFTLSDTFRYLLKTAASSIQSITSLLSKVDSLINDVDPVTGNMRFGNSAFQSWVDRLRQEAPSLVAALLSSASLSSSNACDSVQQQIATGNNSGGRAVLPETVIITDDRHAAAVKELFCYLVIAFGDRTRLDYGSGHELNFIAFLLCLYRVGLFKPTDFRDLVLIVFTKYLKIVRRLQRRYSLEPAGSRGVWGLDDYQFLPFLFGAGQLVGQTDITPQEVADPHIIKQYADEYLYLDAIRWILETKSGAPFGECAPLLNDLTAVPNWSKIHTGMIKMYQAEVLGKLPVIQHFLFGSLLPSPTGLSPVPQSAENNHNTNPTATRTSNIPIPNPRFGGHLTTFYP